jgi:hypothetical protein
MGIFLFIHNFLKFERDNSHKPIRPTPCIDLR